MAGASNDPPKCKSLGKINSNLLSNARKCLLGWAKTGQLTHNKCKNKALKVATTARYFINHFAEDRSSGSNPKTWSLLGSAGAFDDAAKRIRRRYATDTDQANCKKGATNRYWNIIISLARDVIQYKDTKKGIKTKVQKTLRCSLPLLNYSRHATGFYTVNDFSNWMINQYNKSKKPKEFTWAPSTADAQKWAEKRAKYLRNQLNQGGYFASFKSLFNAKYDGENKCSTVFTNTFEGIKRCHRGNNGDIKTTAAYKILLAFTQAAQSHSGADKSWFNDETKYGNFNTAVKAAFDTNISKACFAGANGWVSSIDNLALQDFCFNTFEKNVQADLDKCTKTLSESNKKLHHFRAFKQCVNAAKHAIDTCPWTGFQIYTDYSAECSTDFFAHNYDFKYSETDYGIPKLYREANEEFEKKLWKCANKQHVGVSRHDSAAEKKKFYNQTKKYHTCLEEARGIANLAKYASVKDFLEHKTPENDNKAECIAILEEEEAFKNTKDACKAKKDKIRDSKFVTQKNVNAYNNCLRNKWKNKTKGKKNGVKRSICRHIYPDPLPFVTSEDATKWCAQKEAQRWTSHTTKNGVVNFKEDARKACIKAVKEHKDKPAWKDWKWNDHKGKSDKDFLNGDNKKQNRFWNNCMNNKLHDFITKFQNKHFCAHEALWKLTEKRDAGWRVRCVSTCKQVIKAMGKQRLADLNIFPPGTDISVKEGRETVIANFNDVISSIEEATEEYCGDKVTLTAPKLSADFDVLKCRQRAVKAFRNYVFGCQKYAKTATPPVSKNTPAKKLAWRKNQLKTCVLAGKDKLEPHWLSVCGKDNWKQITGWKNKRWNHWKNAFVLNKNLRSGGARGLHHHSWKTIVENLTKKQFQKQCTAWANDINNANSQSEHKLLYTKYQNDFLKVYREAHDDNKDAKCPFKVHDWDWVKKHQHVTHEYTLSHNQATAINGLLRAACPRGAGANSSIEETTHSECVLGNSEDESFGYFEQERLWWFGRLRRCHSEAEYFRIRHQYYHLIEEYELHNVHVRARCPAIPVWADICSLW